MDFSGYNHQHYQQQQQQQQQQHQHVYEYDPSQIPSYDQSYSYQPYYAYSNQYGYFPNTHQPQFQFQPEPIPVHPPGVTPTAPEPAPSRATHAPTGPSQYRGRGGKTGRPFRGNGRGRGQFNHGSPSSHYGRGRGVGGGKHFPSHSSGPAISNGTGAPTAAGATSVVQPSSSVSGQTPLPKPKACCEICKVECNTPEILEQHKNGKKHKKKMKVHEELQRRSAINEQQSGQIPTSQLNLADQTKKVQESEKKGYPTKNLGSEVTAGNHKDEIELQNNVGETSEVPAEDPEGKTTDKSAVRGRGLKRKMRGGKGGKYMRTNNGSRPVEVPKPEQAISFRCELCSVKCESQVVYQSHLTGKKHLSKLKHVHGPQASSGVAHQALAGVVGLQELYPPDINALSNAINAQIQQGDNDPQVLLAQLLMTVLSQAQVPAVAPLTGHVGPTSVAGSTYEPQLLQTQVSETTSHVEMDNLTGEAKNELLSVPLELNAMAGSSISTQIEGVNSETKQQVLKHPQDSPVMTPADKSGATNDHILSECEAPTS